MDPTPSTPASSPRGYNGQASLDRILSWSHSDVWVWATNNGVESPNPIAFRKHFDVLVHKYGWLFWRCKEQASTNSGRSPMYRACGNSPRIFKWAHAFSDPGQIFSVKGGTPPLGVDFLWAMPTHRVQHDGETTLCTSFIDKWPVRQHFFDEAGLRHRNFHRDVIMQTRADTIPPPVFRRMVIREIWDNAGVFSATKRGQSQDKQKPRRKSSLFGSTRKVRPRRRRTDTKTLTLYMTSSLSSSSSSVESSSSS